MTEIEYQELEKRIKDRERIKAMCADLAADKRSAGGYRTAETRKMNKKGAKPYCNKTEAAIGAFGKTAGGSFQRTQRQTEGYSE